MCPYDIQRIVLQALESSQTSAGTNTCLKDSHMAPTHSSLLFNVCELENVINSVKYDVTTYTFLKYYHVLIQSWVLKIIITPQPIPLWSMIL
jgi:hypothetical protein